MGGCGSQEESSEIRDWLNTQKLGQYSNIFITNGYDSFDAVILMDESDLKNMQIKPGHIKLILSNIKELPQYQAKFNPTTPPNKVQHTTMGEQHVHDEQTNQLQVAPSAPPGSDMPVAYTSSQPTEEGKTSSTAHGQPSAAAPVPAQNGIVSKNMHELTTSDEYRYAEWFDVDPQSNWIKLHIKAKNDAHIALGDEKYEHDGNHWELCLGGWGNSQSVLRRENQGQAIETVKGKILNKKEFIKLWISWTDNALYVGRGDKVGADVWMKHECVAEEEKDAMIRIEYVSVSTGWGSAGEWKLFNVRPDRVSEADFDRQFTEIYNLTTKTDGRYEQWYDVRHKWVVFMVRAKLDAHIRLGEDKQHNGNFWEILLGGWDNTRSVIRKKDNQHHGKAFATGPGGLKGKTFVAFWIAWDEAQYISVGRGCHVGKHMMMQCRYDETVCNEIKYLSVCTRFDLGSEGQWKIALS